MRWIDLFELRNPAEIKDFRTNHGGDRILTSVQQQAARQKPAWKKSLIGAMSRHGFGLIGAGINGAVFDNPKYPYVLKVYRKDQGYDEWLHFCQSHRGNVYVPKIKGSVIRLNSVFSAVRIERLEPCPIQDANTLIDEIQNATDSYANIVKMRETNPDLAVVAQFMRDWEPVSDLSASNVMKRPDRSLVIIDPLYVMPGQSLDW